MAAPANLSAEEIDALTNLTRLLEERNAVIADQKSEIEALRKELLDERMRIAAALGTLNGHGDPPTVRLPTLTAPVNFMLDQPMNNLKPDSVALKDSFVLSKE